MAAAAPDSLLPPESTVPPIISPTESVESVEYSSPVVTPQTPGASDSTSKSSKPQRTDSLRGVQSPIKASQQGAPGPSTCSPGVRRPKPPTKGILKPPPPPAKPTLGGRLRDLAANVVGGGTGRGLFDADDAGPSSRPLGLDLGGPASPGSVSAAVGGTLNAISGRFGMGFSKFVGSVAGGATTPSPGNTPTASPMANRIALPDVGASPVISEKVRQKQPLRRATFVLPSLSITYPISSQGEPWSTKVIEDRQRIESSHRSLLSATRGAEYWTGYKLLRLYETACKGREERPRPGIVRALETLPSKGRPRSIHLILRPFDPSAPASSTPPHGIEVPLNRHAAEALADVLSSEWGLSELKLENGVIEDELALKPILHALLVSGTLPSLSLAGNRRVREKGWRLLAVFLKKARSLKFVDLSDTNWDKRAVEYLVQALTSTPILTSTSTLPPNPPSKDEKDLPPAPDSIISDSEEQNKQEEAIDQATEVVSQEKSNTYGSFIPPAPLLRDEAEETTAAGMQTLRMDGCGLRANLLESLASGIRSSEIKNISLRRNRIGPLGAVALAVMIRDYPDTSIAISNLTPATTSPTLLTQNTPLISLDPASSAGYSPYTPRRRPNGTDYPEAGPTSTDDNLPPIPLVVSNSAGVMSRTIPDGYKPPPLPKHPYTMPAGGTAIQDSVLSATLASAEGKMTGSDAGGASIALQRQVRALDGVERIGRLLTLDLKGNDIRNGVGYIAQVLKRNRTLKVLNLSDNKIEPSGLVALAESLKYNSTLETLDLSMNPCCSPSLEGVSSLRTAFTVNTSLKRLFLADTGLTTEGAIALAEFLPETKSLLHLDLTLNRLDLAGIMAISSGLKSNRLIRCLDVSIPPNNPELAEQSQAILQSCIRNTELAAEGKGTEAIWGPIKKSTLVRQAKEAEELRAQRDLVDIASSVEGKARDLAYKLTPDKLIPVCEVTGRDLEKWLDAGAVAKLPEFQAWEPGQLPKEDFKPLAERAKALRERIADEVQRITDDTTLGRLLELNDSLGMVLDRCKGFVPPSRLLLPSQIVPLAEKPVSIGQGVPASSARQRRHMRGTSLEISSPNFSIGDSDEDSDAEELDPGSIQSSPHRSTRVGLGLHSNAVSHSKSHGGSKMMPSSLHHELSDLRLEAEDDAEEALRDAVSSPVERVGKAWMEEEGEIFRKGTKLGVAEDEEVEEHGDVSGEMLKQEVSFSNSLRVFSAG